MELKLSALNHLKHETFKQEHRMALVDTQGFEIVVGYGATIEAALNDLHSNLI